MPSKFPGMDPYLECAGTFHSFHNIFMTDLLRLLTPQLRPKYVTTTDTNIYVVDDEGTASTTFRPDIAVTAEVVDFNESHGSGTSTLTPPTTNRIALVGEPQKDWFLEIRDAASRRLITVIEVLSPVNKRFGRGRDSYLMKRERLLASETHLVEIDLLRSESRMPYEQPTEGDYLAMVSRASERPDVAIWPIRLQDRLPVVPVPLAGDDADAVLDLQSAFEMTFEAGAYEDYIYNTPPNPPLTAKQLTWVESLTAS